MVTVSMAGPSRSRTPDLTTWGIAVLAVAGLLASVTGGPAAALQGHAFEDAGTAVVWSVLAGLLWRRTAHRTTPVFVAVAGCAALAGAASGYAALDLPAATAAAWLAGWVWVVSTFVPVTLLPATFPSGRWAQRPWLAGGSVAALLLMSAGLATAGRIDTAPGASVANPLALPFADALFLTGSVLSVAIALAATVVLWRRLRRTEGEERRRYVPVVVAVVVTVPALLLGGLVGDWSPVVQLLAAPLVPAAVTLSILQYRLYDVEVVVRRSVVFAGLTVLVVGGYVLVVQATAHLLRREPGTPESVLAAAVVALAFAPGRLALQRLVGHWVYGDRDDPSRALADVNGLLSAAAEPSHAVRLAAQRLGDALRVPWVRVDALDGTVAEVGERPSWLDDRLVSTTGLVHLGVDQGTVSLAPRGPAEPLDSRDRALVAPLASMMAAVLASRRLVADLQRSREHVVLGREEERRRLRRDLHDGVGPLLSGLSSHADVALLRAQRDPGSVAELLVRIRAICDDAVSALRLVVEDLQPAAVDELGLLGALHELVATMSGETVDIELRTEPYGELPAAVEVAAFRITAEALHNAVRHGRPRRIDVHVALDSLGLQLSVRDDGCGIAPDARPGVGSASMRRRAEELGGRLDVESSAKGTVVHALLPVRR